MKAYPGNPATGNAHKVVVSLCDYSGNWPRPWHDAGYTVLCYDLKHGDDVTTLSAQQVRMAAGRAACEAYGFDPLPMPDVRIVMVLAAPPCTDFSVSGAQYWPAKDANGTTAAALAVLDACVALAQELSPDAWVMENPVGRLGTLRPALGKPQYFHPHEFCRWAGVNDDDARVQAERYTKKTGLWGHFNRPDEAGLSPIRVCAQGSWLQKLGGKSERTKELRSMTPTGFARAFADANMR